MMPILTTTNAYTLEIVKALLKHNVSNVAILATIETIEKMNEEQRAVGDIRYGPAEDGYIHLKGLRQRV